MINPINLTPYPINNYQTVYTADGNTALELAGMTAKKVNECVEVVNGVDALASQAQQVVQEMQLAQDDFIAQNNDARNTLITENTDFIATLETAKENFITSVNAEIDEIRNDTETFKNETTTEKTNFIQTLNADISTFNQNGTNAINQFNTDKATALTQFTTDKDNAIALFNTDKTTALNGFATDKTNALNGFTTDKNNIFAQFETDKTNTLNSVDTAISNMLSEMASDGTFEDIINNELMGSINSKLDTIIKVDPSTYGLSGNGAVDDSQSMANLFTAIPNNSRIIFDKSKLYKIDKTGYLVLDGKSNVLIEGLRLTGNCDGTIVVRGGSSNITFKDCYFEKVKQVIWLHDCKCIKVDGCYFKETTYCIIQQAGYSSSYVTVTNCIADNVQRDFVECNCTEVAPSWNWIIANNQYLGNYFYPVAQIEGRFYGGTAVSNVIIANNNVQYVAGDSCVHCEQNGGYITVTGNIFKNSRGRAYIDIQHYDENVLVNGNAFINDEIDNLTPFIFCYGGPNMTESAKGSLKIVNNNFFGHDGIDRVLRLNSNTCKMLVANNHFKGFLNIINMENLENLIFNGNTFKGVNGIKYDTTTATCKQITIVNNLFECTGNAIYLKYGSNGTTYPTNVIISNNQITGKMFIQGCKSVLCYANMIDNDADFTFDATNGWSANMLAWANMIKNGGLSVSNNRMLATYDNVIRTAITSVPAYVGQMAVVGGLPYVAVGVNATTDWKKITTT